MTTLRWTTLCCVLAACSDPEPPRTVTQVVGPAGGTIAGPVGASLTIPSGALPQDTTITVKVAAAGSHPALGGFQGVGEIYAFEPHGLTFAQPVTISLPVSGSTAGLVALRSEPGSAWETLSAQVGGAEAELTTSTFSFYTLARAPGGQADAGLPDGGGGQCSRTGTGPAGNVSDMMGTAPAFTSPTPDWPELALGTIVDGYAEVGFSGNVKIQLTDYPMACGLNSAGQHKIGGKAFQIFLYASGVTAGTYTGQHYLATRYSAEPGTAVGACEATGGDGMSPQAASSIVITSINGSRVAGSFTTTYLGQPLSGTFDVPICPAMAALDPPACCVP